jgi:hypothetical protein
VAPAGYGRIRLKTPFGGRFSPIPPFLTRKLGLNAPFFRVKRSVKKVTNLKQTPEISKKIMVISA